MNLAYYTSYIYNNITFEFFIKLIILYFFIIWIFLLIWVIKDIYNRTQNIYLQIFCILLVLIWTPFFIFIYLVIRPSKTLFEKHYEEIESNLDIFNEIVKQKTTKKKLNNKNKK